MKSNPNLALNLNPELVQWLATISHRAGKEVIARHEHVAWPVDASLSEDTDALKLAGFEVDLEVSDIAVFLSRKDIGLRVELVQRGVTPHNAWVVQTIEEWDTLDRSFTDTDAFEHVDKFWNLDHLRAKMFRHKATGGVIQIVWREKQIYPELFRKRK